MRGAVGMVRGPGMRLFLFGTFLVWTSLVAVNTFVSIRMAGLGGAAPTVGLVWAIGAAVEVPIMWFFPRIARRFGTGPPLIIGAVLFSVRAGIAAIATDPLVLLATAPIEGMAFGLFYVGGVTFVAERASRGLAATAQGLFSAASGLAAIVGSVMGGLIAGATSIQSLFAICSVASLAAAIVVALAVRQSVTPDRAASVASV